MWSLPIQCKRLFWLCRVYWCSVYNLDTYVYKIWFWYLLCLLRGRFPIVRYFPDRLVATLAAPHRAACARGVHAIEEAEWVECFYPSPQPPATLRRVGEVRAGCVPYCVARARNIDQPPSPTAGEGAGEDRGSLGKSESESELGTRNNPQ